MMFNQGITPSSPYCRPGYCTAAVYGEACWSSVRQVDLYLRDEPYLTGAVACDRVINNWRNSGYVVQ